MKTLTILLLLVGSLAAQQWSGILDPTRAVDWTTAGVVGGIPSAAWTNCTTAACNTLNGGTVTATSINNALASAPANTVVRIPAGNFTISSCINFTQSNVALRGAGADQTKLSFPASSNCSGSGLGGSLAAAIHLESGATATALFGGVNTATWTATSYNQGQTTITLSSTAGITAGPIGTGTLIFLDQLNDPSDGYPATGDLYLCENASPCSNQGDANHFGRSGRSMIQGVTVTALAGNVATISPGLRMPNWRSGQTPGAWWVPTTLPIHNSGIENLSIDFTGLGGSVAVQIGNAVNCWFTGNRIIDTQANSNSETYHLYVFQSAHITVQSNYLWGKQSDAGSPLANYTYADVITAENVLENNIFHHNITPIVPNDPAMGNVYAYNYVDDSYTFASSIQFHHAEQMALVEGNNFKNALGDIIHGPHYMNTLYRNHFDRLAHNQSGAGNNGAVQDDTNNRFYNFVANVAGNSGWTKYKQICPGGLNCAAWPYDGDSTAVFLFGIPGSGSGSATAQDSNVGRTAMLWGNWDNITSTNDTSTNDQTGVRWCGNSSDTGWATTCSGTSEVPSGITNYSNPVPTLGDTSAGQGALPASLYLTGKPSWFGSTPFPPIGPDVTGGNAPNTTSTPTGGHANKIPARACFEATAVDPAYAGLSPQPRLFNAAACYPTGVPAVSLSPASPLSFPNQLITNSSNPLAVTLTNTGTGTLTITSIVISGANASEFSQTNNCGSSLGAGLSCIVTVTFRPLTVGAKTASLVFTDNANGSPQSISLQGTGIPPDGIRISGNVLIAGNSTWTTQVANSPGMGISPASLAFGSVSQGQVSTLPLTITSNGNAPLIFSGITLGDSTNYSQTNNCTNIPPTQTCLINVTFNPQSVATLNSSLVLTANDAGSPHSVALTGAGVTAGTDLPLPVFTPTALLLPQLWVDPMVPFTQTIQQTVYIGNSTCPTAPARTNYKGTVLSAGQCDYVDSNGTGNSTTLTDWCAAADQRWDVIWTHGSSFNTGSSPWTWCDKYSGVPTTKYIVFHSDTPNPRGRQVCSHGSQDVLTPPLPDAGQRNHGCAGLLGFPANSVALPVTNAAYTSNSAYNDLANMVTLTATGTGTGSVIQMGPASTLGDPFGDCNSAPCPTDGVNHIVIQDARLMPASSQAASITPVSIKAAEWINTGSQILSTHYLPAAPHDIGFDEDYFTADADDDGFGNNSITDMVQFAAKASWFNHNYMDGIKRDGSEDHGINLADAPGPLQISHNWIEGGSIGLWGGGGSPPAVIGLSSTNVERRRSRLTYNQRWLPSPAGVRSDKKGVTGSCASNVLTMNVTNSAIANPVVYLRNITGVGAITNQWYTATSVTSTQIVVPVTCTNGTISSGTVFGFEGGVNVTSAAAMNGKAVSDPNDQNPVHKNRSENKDSASTVEDGEILENCGADGQSGFCLLISVRACSGVSWCNGGQNHQIIDWVTTNTVIRHANQAVQVSARSGAANIGNWTVTGISCAADGNSAAITATQLNAQLPAPATTQTTYATDIYLAGIGNGVSSGQPLLADGFYATAYPTNGNYANDSVVTALGTGICNPSDTTTTGTVYGPQSGNGAGVSNPGRRYVFQNNLIYDIGNHSAWDGSGAVTLLQNGGGVNNWGITVTVTQTSPTLIANAVVNNINSCPVNGLCPKVLQAAVGDYAYVQCLADTRFSSGAPQTKGAPILSVAGDQLSFTYTPQNGSPALNVGDSTTCPIVPFNSSTDSGYYGSQSFPWPFYWNHNTAVGVNNFSITPGGGGFNKSATFTNSFQLVAGAAEVAPAQVTANSGGFRCNNNDKYSATDLTGVTFCNDRVTLTYQNSVVATRSIANNPNFSNGTICGTPPCSQDPAVNPNTNSVPARVSTPGSSVTCSGVPCDSTHFLPDSVGLQNAMSTSNYPLNASDFRTYVLDPSSPYRASGLLHSTDSKDLGVQMSILLNAQNRTLYSCGLPCGTGPYHDGPQYGWLVWTASTDPNLVNYRVYRDGAASPAATVTTTYFTDYGLATGSHTWVVKAWNGTVETSVLGLVTTTF